MNEFRSKRFAILAKGFLAKGLFLVVLGFKIASSCLAIEPIIRLYVFDRCDVMF